MDIVTAATFQSYIDANLAANCLRQHNINCFLADEYSSAGAVVPLSIEARVMVNKKDLNRSMIVLAALSL